MTREEFEELKVGDKVRHAFGGIGVVVKKDNMTYTVRDKRFGFNGEVSFAWNEGGII
ncbi:hypothetical protein [Prevotella koreensis]